MARVWFQRSVAIVEVGAVQAKRNVQVRTTTLPPRPWAPQRTLRTVRSCPPRATGYGSRGFAGGVRSGYVPDLAGPPASHGDVRLARGGRRLLRAPAVARRAGAARPPAC